MDPQTRHQAIDLYDRFTHEGMDRRVFIRRMAAIAGSVAAAEALIGSIAASPAAAAIVPADDKRLTTRVQKLANGYSAYVAEPRTRSLKPTVIVIHENRGLNEHIRDVTRRIALAGYRGVAADFLSPSGGTPSNEDAARDAIGKLDLAKSVSDAVAIIDELSKSSRGGKVGAVGFCWGGGFVNRLAVAAGDKLDAGVPYYGPAPDPAEAPKVEAAMLIHDAGLDDRVNRTSFPWVEALRATGKTVRFYLYDGANHAFNNDTSVERYDKAAATLAWGRTVAFFKRHLA
ncbi:dienelactone hydrolase family protein [Sphingomonas sp. RG327]|uniref:Dienelactone hydrolase family protein n=1 Tax=Sphingomonas anseongensis TaxID=2908207 RepID=A0ABT0RBU8_9SPHN|nr:dienelactone hydrolase family protein [Sphingomonas anseongensis]MCL6677724.1 dienelactone hydrolase family protein [Sphingomonas anseongensis]